MPALEILDLRQRAVVWFRAFDINGVPRSDQFGQPVVFAPAEMLVRWVEQQREALDPKGNTITVDGTIVAAQAIPLDSVAWLGSLADFPTALTLPGLGTGAEPEGLPWPSGLVLIKTSSTASDLKNRFVRRSYGYQRYKDATPTVVS